MQAFLAKPRSVLEVQKAAKKQNIWRGKHAVGASFSATLKPSRYSIALRTIAPTASLICARRFASIVIVSFSRG